MKIPVDIEKTILDLLKNLPKDECLTIPELVETLKVEKEKLRNKVEFSKAISRCKINIDGGRIRTGYINPKFVK